MDLLTSRIAPLYNNLDQDAMAFNPSSPLQQGIMDDNGEMISTSCLDRIMYQIEDQGC